MVNSQFGCIPLGDGLFKMGNDIVCSYPLLSVELDEISSDHQITFVYEPYSIIVSWTESTEGIRTNPHWQRVYNS